MQNKPATKPFSLLLVPFALMQIQDKPCPVKRKGHCRTWSPRKASFHSLPVCLADAEGFWKSHLFKINT